VTSTPGRCPPIERIVGVGLFLIVSLWTATTQQPARVFGDASEYWRMSQQFGASHEVATADGPFVFRPATPLFAAVLNPVILQTVPRWVDGLVDDALGLDDVPPYYVLGAVLSLITLWLLQSYLRCFVASAGVRLLLIAMWLSLWHAPVRWGFFNPINVEPLWRA